ncbi:MAG: DUF177 domain-containing protein [Bacteroidales bacterium]|nr:DUF177 domain-containing protein [Bacteroidales bacterium]
MKTLIEYNIAYIGLAEGSHFYSYKPDKKFFEVYPNEDIISSDLIVELELIKKATHLELRFNIEGSVVYICDRCNETYNDKLSSEQTIYIKFGEEYSEEDENLYVLPDNDSEFDVSPFINELIVVAIPMKKVHSEDENGNYTCGGNLIDYIANTKNEGAIDPRWNELKKLKDGTS